VSAARGAEGGQNAGADMKVTYLALFTLLAHDAVRGNGFRGRARNIGNNSDPRP